MDTKRPTAREAIIAAAFEVLSRNPGAKLSDIAERAGVGRATLHRYFASRDDLIQALAMTAVEEMDEAAEVAMKDARSYSEALKAIVSAFIPLGDRYSFLMREPLEESTALAEEFERQAEETRQLIEKTKKEGLFDPAVPTDWLVQAFDHLLYAGWESVRTGQTTPRQAADLAWRTLTHGLKA
ncbi:MAG: TetR/AcrR family transcriptional regulator [Aquisalinus sp.]|nr:TetR/AcrR family transcriptional regulator [Aquisalinus sp.]